MLADQDAPLKLADGTLIYKNGRVVKPGQPQVAMVEIPTNSEARELVVRTRRQLVDLPAVPKTMAAINVVLVYELFGLSDDEIAVASGLTSQQVMNIKATSAYATMRGHVTETVLKAESEDVRTLFQQKAKIAADQITDLMRNGKQEVRLSAAKDILDRAGHRPVDVYEHRVSLEGELRITYIEPEKVEPITIEMDPS